MTSDPSDREERRISTDRETIREWADRHDAVPVRRQSGGTEQLVFVPETQTSQDANQLGWDSFYDELDDRELAVIYHGETATDPLEVQHHDDVLAASGVDDDRLRDRLIAGETVTTEVEETTVVESVVVEEATVESELVGADVVDQQIVDVELVERGCSNCGVVGDQQADDREWFDTDRFLASLEATRDERTRSAETTQDTDTTRSAETTRSTETTGDTETTTDIGETGIEGEYPFSVELDIEEAWAVTRELTEQFTVESRIVDTDVTEVDTIEDHDLDVEGLQQSILEQGLLGVEDEPDVVMAEYDIETELDEADRVETYFERTRVIEDDVVDRMRARADIISAETTQMEITNEQSVATDLPGGATDRTADTTTETAGESAAADRVALSQEDVDKPVVDDDGEQLGTVDAVGENGRTMTVDPDQGLTEKIMSTLGWGDESDNENTISTSQVAMVTDDEIRLKPHEELGEHRDTHEST